MCPVVVVGAALILRYIVATRARRHLCWRHLIPGTIATTAQWHSDNFLCLCNRPFCAFSQPFARRLAGMSMRSHCVACATSYVRSITCLQHHTVQHHVSATPHCATNSMCLQHHTVQQTSCVCNTTLCNKPYGSALRLFVAGLCAALCTSGGHEHGVP